MVDDQRMGGTPICTAGATVNRGGAVLARLHEIAALLLQ